MALFIFLDGTVGGGSDSCIGFWTWSYGKYRSCGGVKSSKFSNSWFWHRIGGVHRLDGTQKSAQYIARYFRRASWRNTTLSSKLAFFSLFLANSSIIVPLMTFFKNDFWKKWPGEISWVVFNSRIPHGIKILEGYWMLHFEGTPKTFFPPNFFQDLLKVIFTNNLCLAALPCKANRL